MLALCYRSVFLHMVTSLRVEQIEQIDPRSLNWQKHFNSSSVKRPVNVNAVMLLLARFYTAQLSMTAHMDTHTAENWRTAVIVNDSQYKRALTAGEKNKHIKSSSTSNTFQHLIKCCMCFCVRVSKCISVCISDTKWEKKYSVYKVWRQDENRWSRWRRMNKTDNMNKPDDTRWGGNLHQGKMFVQPVEL